MDAPSIPIEVMYERIVKTLRVKHAALHLPSPIEPLHSPTLQGVSQAKVWIKRDDLISPLLPGNKFRKLVPHLYYLLKTNERRVLTFGGAYSNHLYAFASAVKLLGLDGIACIRGERREPLNPILNYAEACGVRLHFIDRGTYRQRHTAALHKQLEQTFGPFYLIPEGGTDEQAVMAVAQIAKEVRQQIDEVFVAVGTGGTLAGLAQGFAGRAKVVGVSSLKGAADLDDEVRALVGPGTHNWIIDHGHHFGGYAKATPELWRFMTAIESETGIRFDPIYTAKALFALRERLQQSSAKNEQFLFVHTGGVPLDTRQGLQKN